MMLPEAWAPAILAVSFTFLCAGDSSKGVMLNIPELHSSSSSPVKSILLIPPWDSPAARMEIAMHGQVVLFP